MHITLGWLAALVVVFCVLIISSVLAGAVKNICETIVSVFKPDQDPELRKAWLRYMETMRGAVEDEKKRRDKPVDGDEWKSGGFE